MSYPLSNAVYYQLSILDTAASTRLWKNYYANLRNSINKDGSRKRFYARVGNT